MDDAGLVLEAGGDYSKLVADTNRAFTTILKGMDGVEARTNRLEKNLAGIGKSFNGRRVVDDLGAIQGALNRVNPGSAEKALANVFDRSRLGVLQEAGAKIPIFGSALADLGPAGLAAGAGIAVAALAIERAIKFTEKSADIERMSKELGLTTTQVQELQHVFTELNIPAEKGMQSISGLAQAIGRVETNSARANSLKVFTDGLKITPAELKGWGTLDQQLPHILDSLAKMNVEAREGFAKRIGMDPGVLNSLVEGRNRYADLVAEAHRYGLVIDADVVKKGAEANEKLKTAGEIISTNLTVAFADLAPVIVKVANNIADATRALNEFIQSFKQVDKRNSGALELERSSLIAEDADLRRHGATLNGPAWRNPLFTSPTARLQDIGAREVWIDTVLNQRAAAEAKEEQDQGKGTTPTIPGAHHAHADHSASEISEAEVRYLEALERGAKDLDEAHAIRLQLAHAQYLVALAHAGQEKNLGTRATLVDTAGKTYGADINDENERYAKAQADHARGFNDEQQRLQEGQLAAQAEITGQLQDRQAADRQRLADEQDQAAADLANKLRDDKAYQSAAGRQEADRLNYAQIQEFLAQTEALRAKQAKESADQADDVALRELEFDHQRLEALQKLAKTQDQRRRIAEQLLDNEQKTAELQLGKRARSEGLSGDQLAGAQGALSADFGSRRADLGRQFAGPLAKFADQNNIATLGDQLQDNAVKAVDTLNSGLAEAIANGKSLHDVLKKALKDFLASSIQSGLKSGEGSLLGALHIGGAGAAPGVGDPNGLASAPGGGAFGSALGAFTSIFKLLGFADGTPSAPGGLAVVGERGPELMRVPRGSQVYSNAGLTALTRGLSARGGGNLQVSLQSTYDLRGVAGDRTIDAKIAAAHGATVDEIMSVLPSVIPGVMAQHQVQAG